MAEAAVIKSSNASKKRRSDGLGGSKNKRSLATTTTSKISETFEDSLSSLLMSNVPTSEYTDEKPTGSGIDECSSTVIKRTFHLGGPKYVIYQGYMVLLKIYI